MASNRRAAAEAAARERLATERDPFQLAVQLLKDASAADSKYKRTQATNAALGDEALLVDALAIYLETASALGCAIETVKVRFLIVHMPFGQSFHLAAAHDDVSMYKGAKSQNRTGGETSGGVKTH
eukprot:SAG31_NODE_11755_length_1001_cov_0.847007_1_plen_126_part_00